MDIISNKRDDKCHRHPTYNVELLKVNNININSNQHLLYCHGCLDEDESINQRDCILIQKIIGQGSHSIIPKWPPLNNPQILIHIQEEIKKIIPFEQIINEFFNQFINEVVQKIQECKKNLINIIQELPNQNNKIIERYQKSSKICELKRILIDYQTQHEERERKCRQLVSQMENQKDNNSKLFESILQDCKKSINLNFLQDIKSSVLQTFDVLIVTPFVVDIKEKQYLKQPYYTNANIEQIAQLIQNSCQLYSNESLTSLKSILKIISPLVEQTINNIKDSSYKNELSILPQISFSQTNFQKQFNNFIFSKNDINQITIQTNLTSSTYIQCILNYNLEKDQEYKFRFKIVIPNNESFAIGLVRDSEKNKSGINDHLLCFFYKQDKSLVSSDYSGISYLKKKGDFKVDTVTQELELSVSQKDSILEFTDYPHYKSILSVNEQNKKNLKSYKDLKLFLLFGNKDIKITLIEALSGVSIL